jgi:hypothetical protein
MSSTPSGGLLWEANRFLEAESEVRDGDEIPDANGHAIAFAEPPDAA